MAVRIGSRHGQTSKRARRKAAGSKGAMSSIPSPTPTSLTGTSSYDSIAITAPPLALLSSFASTSPVIGIALLKARAWTRLVRSEEHTSELQSRQYLVCRLLLE